MPLQLCPTLCDPIDSSPPGSPVPGILQARTLEWVSISFSNARKWKVKVKSLSRVRPSATPWTAAFQAPLSMGFFQATALEWDAIAFSVTETCQSQIHPFITNYPCINFKKPSLTRVVQSTFSSSVYHSGILPTIHIQPGNFLKF